MGSDQGPSSRLLEIVDVLVVVRAGAVEVADADLPVVEVRVGLAAVLPLQKLAVVRRQLDPQLALDPSDRRLVCRGCRPVPPDRHHWPRPLV